MVASSVGGIRDQIEHGRHGLLVDDPTDAGAAATAMLMLLDDRRTAARRGAAAQRRVRREFLDDRQLSDWAGLLCRGEPA